MDGYRPLGIAALEDKIVQQAVVTSSIRFTKRISWGSVRVNKNETHGVKV